MEKRQRTRLASALILAVVFGAGVLVGFAVDRTATAAPVAEAPDAGQEEREEEDGDRDRRRAMYEQVGELSEEQRTRIDSVVAEFRRAGREMGDAQKEELEPLREKWEARYDSLLQATRAGIKAAMTAEQAQRYDSLVAEWEARMNERRRERDSDGDRRD